jgi:hypothetical protein
MISHSERRSLHVLFLIAIPLAHGEMEVNKSNPHVGRTLGECDLERADTRLFLARSAARWFRVSRPARVARHEMRRTGLAQSVPTDMNVVATIGPLSARVKHCPNATPIFYESMVEGGVIACSAEQHTESSA